MFGYFWVNAFLVGSAQFILAVGVATWYFSHTTDSSGGKKRGSARIRSGFWWLARYHQGSIALGSMIIAICQLIRCMFEWYRRLATGTAWTNPLLQCLLKITSYCLACLNRFVKFITKNGYIMIALGSDNFCYAAWRAFTLIISHTRIFVMTTGIGFFFNFLGKLLIMLFTIGVGYIFVGFVPIIRDEISSAVFVLIVIGVMGFTIGAFYISMFSFSMDAMLLCFLVDETLAGHGESGKHRPPELDLFAATDKLSKFCCCC